MTKWVLLFLAVVLAMVEAMSTSARSVRSAQVQASANGDYSAIRASLARAIADGGVDSRALPNQLSSTLTAANSDALAAAISALDTPKTQAQVVWCQFDLSVFSVTPTVFGTAPAGVVNYLGLQRPNEIVVGYFEVVRKGKSLLPISRLTYCSSPAEFGTPNDSLSYAGSVARVNVYLSEVLAQRAAKAWTPAAVDAASAPVGTVRYFPDEQKLKTNSSGAWQALTGVGGVGAPPAPPIGNTEMMLVPASSVAKGFWIGVWPASLDSNGAAVHSSSLVPARNLTQQQAAAACAARGWKLPTFKQWIATNPNLFSGLTTVGLTGEAGSGHSGRGFSPATNYSLPTPAYTVGIFEWLRDTSDRSAYPATPAAAGGNYYNRGAYGWLKPVSDTDVGVTSSTTTQLGGFLPWRAYLSKSITGTFTPPANYVQRVLLPGYPSTSTGAAVLNVAKNNVSEFPDYCTGYCTGTAALAVRPNDWNTTNPASPFWSDASIALFVGRSYATPASPASDDITVGFRCVKSLE